MERKISPGTPSHTSVPENERGYVPPPPPPRPKPECNPPSESVQTDQGSENASLLYPIRGLFRRISGFALSLHSTTVMPPDTPTTIKSMYPIRGTANSHATAVAPFVPPGTRSGDYSMSLFVCIRGHLRCIPTRLTSLPDQEPPVSCLLHSYVVAKPSVAPGQH